MDRQHRVTDEKDRRMAELRTILLKRTNEETGTTPRSTKRPRIDSSASLSSSDSEYTETFSDRWFHHDEPFLFNEEHDGFLVQSNTMDEKVNHVGGKISLFTRDLRSYKKGSVISKRCGPFGELNVFGEGYFVVKKKFFNHDGQVSLILLKKESSGSQFLLATPPLFGGWIDTDGMNAYLEYHKSLSV